MAVPVDTIDPNAIKDSYDVVIVGGGMVGASLALQLSNTIGEKIRILVVERFSFSSKARQTSTDVHSFEASYNPSFDARSTALSFGSRKILDSLGIWSEIGEHLSQITNIHVSDRGRMGSATLNASDADWSSLGYVVENAWLGDVLMAALRKKDNVDFCVPAEVSAIIPRKQGVDIVIQGNKTADEIPPSSELKTVNTQLVVIADGANSTMRDFLGIATDVVDYRQTAVIANVSFRKPHEGMAYERFTEKGPMALLPLTPIRSDESRSALVWTMDSDRAHYLCECSSSDFLQELQASFGHRQGEFVRVGDRFNYPLQLIEAKEQVRSGVVVMGNAAHSMHPVAGQGFNLALRDCARLVGILKTAFNESRPLGQLSLLQDYFQQQQFDQKKTVLFSDRVTALFSNKQWALSLLRKSGLGLIDISPTLKRLFITHAAGMHDGAAGVISVSQVGSSSAGITTRTVQRTDSVSIHNA
ncbi:MAG: 2-octaprenyl-6-methoxyphenol hydroxylase [Oceanicoccus sp.]|jgi:2-octaprenyl-6-methoxyphenol hydroxylase